MIVLSHTCPVCNGDGKETCHSPDHRFIGMAAGLIGGHYCNGCPCCGWDEDHKVPNGGYCEECNGIGRVSESRCIKLLWWYGIDEPETDYEDNSGIFVSVPEIFLKLKTNGL